MSDFEAKKRKLKPSETVGNPTLDSARGKQLDGSIAISDACSGVEPFLVARDHCSPTATMSEY